MSGPDRRTPHRAVRAVARAGMSAPSLAVPITGCSARIGPSAPSREPA